MLTERRDPGREGMSRGAAESEVVGGDVGARGAALLDFNLQQEAPAPIELLAPPIGSISPTGLGVAAAAAALAAARPAVTGASTQRGQSGVERSRCPATAYVALAEQSPWPVQRVGGTKLLSRTARIRRSWSGAETLVEERAASRTARI